MPYLSKASLAEKLQTFGDSAGGVILKDPNYTDWCVTTMKETGGLEGTANWHLKRYATWAQEVCKNPQGMSKLPLQHPPVNSQTSSSGMGSMSSFSLVHSVKNNANTEKEEEMFSDSKTENRIQALEDQIRDLRRQGKKGKTPNNLQEGQ